MTPNAEPAAPSERVSLSPGWIRRARTLLRWSSATLARRAGIAFPVALAAQLDREAPRIDPDDVLRIRLALGRAGIAFPQTASGDVTLVSRALSRLVDQLHTVANRADVTAIVPTGWRLVPVEDGLRIVDADGHEAASISVVDASVAMLPPVRLARSDRIAVREVAAWISAASTARPMR